MKKERKSRAFNPLYESPLQGFLPGFEHPFERELDSSNRWVVLSHLIPWDELCSVYMHQTGVKPTGRASLNPRIVIGSLIIKYLCKLDDRETVDKISENIYMQYFLGYPSFTSDKPFDASLFVDIRKRLGMESINAINEKIVQLKTRFEEKSAEKEASPESSASGQSDAFNEGNHMETCVEKYRARFGFYPREVLADKIYCTRDNRKMLKNKGSGIILRAKPLGRPSASAVSIHVSPGERNPIEGKFGQVKTGYGLNRIKARLKETSESWIAGIILVLNLVKLAGAAAPCLIMNVWRSFSIRIQKLFRYQSLTYRENICPFFSQSIILRRPI